MKHAFRFALAVLTIAALQATVAFADPVTYSIDKSHTEVGFEIRHIFSKVQGRFNSFTAKIVFDEKTPANISVEASADANSIWTDNERRDGHLKSADFFDAEKFPVITFKSTKVVAAGKNKYKITGDFTMHGQTSHEHSGASARCGYTVQVTQAAAPRAIPADSTVNTRRRHGTSGLRRQVGCRHLSRRSKRRAAPDCWTGRLMT